MSSALEQTPNIEELVVGKLLKCLFLLTDILVERFQRLLLILQPVFEFASIDITQFISGVLQWVSPEVSWPCIEIWPILSIIRMLPIFIHNVSSALHVGIKLHFPASRIFEILLDSRVFLAEPNHICLRYHHDLLSLTYILSCYHTPIIWPENLYLNFRDLCASLL